MVEKIENINRRKFLVRTFGLVNLLGLGVGGALYVFNRGSDDKKLLKEFNKEIDVNKLLEEFPTQIPGAGEVRKYETNGARYCLVHVLQKHQTPKTRKENAEEIKKIQEDIYTILSYLAEKQDISEVYTEGFADGDVETRISYDVQNFLERRKKLLALSSELSKDKKIGQKLDEEIHDFNERYASLLKIFEKAHGALGRLFLEEKITLVPAETSEAKILARDRKNRELVTDNREDVLLELIAKSSDGLAFTVYGGAHAWGGEQSFGEAYSLKGRESYKDNIYEWNIKNPDKKFSLIEIIPASYRLSD